MHIAKQVIAQDTYIVKVLTRSTTSASALELASLSNVTLIQGETYDEATLHTVFQNTTHCFINTNGFATGEKAEIYWGIRMYEIAISHGVQHFLYSSLEYALRLGDYDPKFRTGHLDGKAKVADWISAQPKGRMIASVLTSCMYMDMLSELLAPSEAEDGTMVFTAPLGGGHAPLIYLEDFGRYARWVFDHPEKSTGLNLHVATEDVSWEYLAQTFTDITGRKAIYREMTLPQMFDSGVFPDPERKVGHSVADDGTLQSVRENFSGFWETWKADVVRKDYKLLDDVLPDRVKSVGEWMRLTGYTGEKKSVLKDYEDERQRSGMKG
ncbi:hypothetical protein B7494_g1653 [Chlorociboria aeruginascens]|nr:hypothetical protein B7494_g1653 [Chlorociboria aeruginascens]